MRTLTITHPCSFSELLLTMEETWQFIPEDIIAVIYLQKYVCVRVYV